MRTLPLIPLIPLLAACTLVFGCDSKANLHGSIGQGGAAGGLGGGQPGNAAGAAGTGVAGHDGGSGAGGMPGDTTGNGGSTPPLEPPADISGRWGMFEFEDPVGVQLFEAPDGTLTGMGCAAGAPGAGDLGPGNLCGSITGRVTGQTASFSFPLVGFAPKTAYSAQVVVSHDRQRMAGDFSGVDGPTGPMAWLRIPDGDAWLRRFMPTDSDPLSGYYALDLIADASEGDEYRAGTSYTLGYFARSLTGDLGGFWNTEMSDPMQGSPVRVGPVPVTVPTLPISLSLEFDSTGFVNVSAATPSGGFYRFAAKRKTTP